MIRKFLFFILFFSTLCFSESKPVFHCSFEDEAKDLIGNRTSEIKGGKFVEGKIGKGIYLDGKEKDAECVFFKDTGKEKFVQDFDNGPFTISLWIKPDSTKEYNKPQEILNTGTSGTSIGPGWALTYFWRMIQFRTGTGKRDEQGKGDYWEIKTNPSIDKIILDDWNHIAVVRNEDGILVLYLNGKKVAESEKKFDIIPSNYPLTIGAYRSGYGYGFKGIIDEVKIYKGALSSEEILIEYKGDDKKKIKLDGKLEEQIWEKGKIFTNFRFAGTPTPAYVQTKVILNYDSDNLYIAFTCDEPDMEHLKDNVKENGLKVFFDDSVELMVDFDNNKVDYYHFLFNPSGHYGVEFRSQGGAISLPVEDFRLYVCGLKEKDRWVVEAAIPFSSLVYERVKGQILVNFGRNRRVSLERKEETSSAEKGAFHNPDLFDSIRLQDVDLSAYQIETTGFDVRSVERTDDARFDAKLKGTIKNLLNKDREICLEIYEKKLGVLEKLNLQILPDEEKNIEITITVPEAKEYKLSMNLNEKGKTIYDRTFPVNVSYSPISLELLYPVYRNSIYPSQKVDRLILNTNVGLGVKDIKGVKQEVLVLDSKGNTINRKSTECKKEQNVEIGIPELKTGEYRIIARLTKEGEIIYEASIPLYKLPPAKGSEVYIDESLNLVLNGKPIMPLVWWTSLPFETAKTGADGVILIVGDKAKQYLDELHKINQLGAVMPFTSRDEEKCWAGKDVLTQQGIEIITEKVNSIKDHPALLYYYLIDEPEGKINFSPKIIKET
ncbi:MAG: hypothetical protein NC907_03075, partial [Candidatus Omnitrophica bacterium]|nr:hypothetical protein [Candidatus Omnitrophota bacterium]